MSLPHDIQQYLISRKRLTLAEKNCTRLLRLCQEEYGKVGTDILLDHAQVNSMDDDKDDKEEEEEY